MCKNGLIQVNLNGGLGNQLFQFSAATNLAIIEGKQLVFVEANQIWKSRLNFLGIEVSSIYMPFIENNKLYFTQTIHETLAKFCYYRNYHEKMFNYEKIYLPSTHTRLHGYFQSIKYFDENKYLIRSFIKLNLNKMGYKSSFANILQIRMGDMARDPEIRKVHGVVTDDFLERALKVFEIDSKLWLQISDDSEMIESELPNFFALNMDKHKSHSDFEDLYLLSEAKNLIISNSTFGWWGAWLSGGQVVAPVNWFSKIGMATRDTKDLFPQNWTLV